MKKFIPESLQRLAQNCAFPIYVVGGSVRDFLSGHACKKSDFSDWDICAPQSIETIIETAKKVGFYIQAEYKNTGTVKLKDETGINYEFTYFRSDKYIRGTHVPVSVFFTDDISLDAQRRDFTANAVYYDVKNNRFCDPLGGVEDIKNKRLRTVRESKKVFGEDGLRLMRLARQCGQLGFTPDEDTLKGAKENACLIQDIAPERIFAELNLMLRADEKHGVKNGHYLSLRILEQSGVLRGILPELCLGKGMAQPKTFHNYDVLEHSLRCVLYAPASIRWAALLHDVGKPYCMQQEGNYHRHPTEGTVIADNILTRLKAPKSLIKATRFLIEEHMYDIQSLTKEGKLRRYLVKNYTLLPDLLALKQADYSACKDDISVAPTVKRWNELLKIMQKECVPFTLKQLNVNGALLLETGIPAAYIGKVLNRLLLHCATQPLDNTTETLLKISHGIYNNLINNEK